MGEHQKDRVESLSIDSPPFESVRMLEIELSQPLPDIPCLDDRTGLIYRRAWVLVRLHTQPLGLVQLNLGENGLAPQAYAGQIWGCLHEEINDHLLGDGLHGVSALEASGIASPCVPVCTRERGDFLARAPFVSVIICTRDRPQQLAAALSSVVRSEYPHFEVIVVDNASETTETAELLDEQYRHFPNIRYTREVRPGVSWARNRGLWEAKGEIVAFTDDDVIVDEYWLAELVRGFEAADDVACVTGLTLPAEVETQPQMWFEELGGFTFGFNRIIHNMATARLPHRLYPFSAIKFGTGVNIAFKASQLCAVHGFDPAFPNGQDIEAYYRVMKSGHTMVYEPSALVRHFHRRDYAALQRQLHNYGVAFTAFLTKCAIHDPIGAVELIGKLPYGLYATLSPSAPRHAKKQSDFPKELTKLERRGMAAGPFIYFRNRWQVRRVLRQFGPPEQSCN